MSHEIYYTSAPEGLKPGQRGFCTVAATEGLPKALWERLESLSGYRHHFEPGTRGAANPVAYAHWLLHITGKEYHVLSRICDSGFDYTQRTNAFAHHVVLEPQEMAPAGPAWMLAQDGALADQWDGQSRSIVRASPLPYGDSPGGIARRWQELTGDAGWAGALAEAFTRSPRRPVCIIFSPEQEVLPLIGEAIALLPSASRWQVTFNTYFTSMPTSAVCAWRCCLAGSPAAAATQRYAAGGLLIDLTDLAQLGTPPDSPWVTKARTGIAAAAPVAPSPATPAGRPGKARPKPSLTFRNHPSLIALADEVEDKAGPPPLPAEAPVSIFAEPPALPAAPAPELPRDWASRFVRSRHEEATMAEDAEQRSHRRRLVMIYILACLTLGMGTWLLFKAFRSSSDSEPPPVPPQHSWNTPPVSTAPVTPPDPNVVRPPNPATTPVVVVPPIDRPPIDKPPVATAPVAGPKAIALAEALGGPAGGAGIRDKMQAIAIPAREIDDLRNAGIIGIVLPNERNEYVYNSGNLSGTLSAATVSSLNRPAFSIRWKDAKDPAGGTEVLNVQLDKTKAQLEFTWRSAMVLRRPDVAALAFWTVQNSALFVSDIARSRPQRIELKPFEGKTIAVSATSTPLGLPCEPPPGAVASVTGLPGDWVAREAPGALPSGAAHLFQLTKPTSLTWVTPQVALTFSNGWSAVQSDFATRKAADESELEKWTRELATAEAQISRLNVDAQQDITQNERSLAGSPDELNHYVEARRRTLAEDLKAPTAKKEESEQACRAYKAAIAGYGELANFDVVLKLPDGSRITSVRFRQ